MTRFAAACAFSALAAAAPVLLAQSAVQVKGQLPAGITPAWTQGIQPITSASYYNAIACGKQGGDNPTCVFYDTGLCANDDFTLAMYTPYKQVAYEVWTAVHNHQPAPTPSFQAAQRTRVTLGITPKRGTNNPITALNLKRGGRTIEPATRSMGDGGGRFIFDPAAFAPSAPITIEMVGRARTIACTLDAATLSRMR